MTGVALLGIEITGKRLELLLKLVPTAKSIAAFVGGANTQFILKTRSGICKMGIVRVGQDRSVATLPTKLTEACRAEFTLVVTTR